MARTLTEKARQAASKLGVFTFNDLASSLKKHNKIELKKVRKVVGQFQKSGEIVTLRRGLYRYQGKEKPLNRTAKMWRAIRIKEYFTRQDIQKLSGASKAYVCKYFLFLTREGHIADLSGRGFKNRLYCLSDSDKAPLQHPVYKI